MYTIQRLNQVYRTAKEIPFDDTSKFILFSDCHRGDNGLADDFKPNRNLFLAALNHYYAQGFTYIEIGDGDELWKNRSFSEITKAHSEVFMALKKFYDANRFYMIWGNHDIVKKNSQFVKNYLYTFYNDKTNKTEPLFPNLKVYDGLILKHTETLNKIFVVHGHQGDMLNDYLWPIARILVRYVWRPLEIFGISNRTSPATNHRKRELIERNLGSWADFKHQLIIAGHTHRPVFPDVGETPYFNTGCCLFPNYITCIEISQGEITLLRWYIKVSSNGSCEIAQEILAGPRPLNDFFNN